MEERQWNHLVWTSDGTKHNVYKNGANTYYNATGGALDGTTGSTVRIGTTADSLNAWLNGFIDELIIYKGVFMDANTVIQHYMTGRAGSHLTANSSTVLHIKSDDVYGSTNITDSSPAGHSLTNVGTTGQALSLIHI